MKHIIKMVPIEDIIVSRRKRPLKDFEALKTSIKEVGLLNPITVYRNVVLVAGYHRLEACKALKWKEIPVINLEDDNLKAEQAQIDENIIRNKLTALEMAEQLMRRKKIYEIKYPERTRIALAIKMIEQNRRNSSGTEIISVPEESFVEDVSLKIGKTPRTISYYIQIATDIPEDIRTLIKGTTIEDRLTDLLKLSRITDKDRQRELVEKIINGEATTIAGVIRKEKQTDGINLPDLTKPTVPTSLFKRLYDKYIDLEIKYSKLQLEQNPSVNPL